MTKIYMTTAIKKFILLSIAITTMLTLITGCGATVDETPAPEASEEPTPAATASVEETQTPEVRDAVPADCLATS
jgi:hypothetical protein